MIEIGSRPIGPAYPPFFIADVGSNHDGSLPRALTLIDLAAAAGADAVKFQNFYERTIVSRRGFAELGKLAHQATWEKGVYETYEAASIPLDWTPILKKCCDQLGVAYLATAYSKEICDAIDPYVPAHKIGSGDITDWDYIRHVARKGKPALISTGASSWKEVDDAVGAFLDGYEGDQGRRLIVMQCNTDYSGSPQSRYANLSVLPWWRDDYGVQVGLSDHYPDHLAACAAVALGARVIEKHLTDDRTREGPDHAFALEPNEFAAMVEATTRTWETLGDGRKKVEENELEARVVQRRALRYERSLEVGHVLGPSDVVPLRPCPEGALEPYRTVDVVGRVLRRDVEGDDLVRLEDFE